MLEVDEHLRKHLSLVLAGSRRFTYVNHKRLVCICIYILKLELVAATETRARNVGFAHVPQLVSLVHSVPRCFAVTLPHAMYLNGYRRLILTGRNLVAALR
jgi:hypothetical protein